MKKDYEINENINYIHNALKIILLSLPIVAVNIIDITGNACDKSFTNSLGVTAIAAFSLLGVVDRSFRVLPKVLNSTYMVLLSRAVAGSKNSSQDDINSLNSVALLLMVIYGIISSILLIMFHSVIAHFLGTDTDVETILSRLLVIFPFILLIFCIDKIVMSYLICMRYNKRLQICCILFYVALISSDATVIYFQKGPIWLYIWTLIDYIAYIFILILSSKIRLGKIRRDLFNEIYKLSYPLLIDRLCHQVCSVVQAKIVGTLGTEVYALLSVASSINDLFEEVVGGFAQGWQLYTSKWIEEAKVSLYNIKKQLNMTVIILICFYVIVAIITIYPLWFVYGRELPWIKCLPAIIGYMLNVPVYIYYVFENYTLRAYKETKSIKNCSLISGLLIRVPLQLLLYITNICSIYTIIVTVFIDVLVRSVYLYIKLNQRVIKEK